MTNSRELDNLGNQLESAIDHHIAANNEVDDAARALTVGSHTPRLIAVATAAVVVMLGAVGLALQSSSPPSQELTATHAGGLQFGSTSNEPLPKNDQITNGTVHGMDGTDFLDSVFSNLPPGVDQFTSCTVIDDLTYSCAMAADLPVDHQQLFTYYDQAAGDGTTITSGVCGLSDQETRLWTCTIDQVAVPNETVMRTFERNLEERGRLEVDSNRDALSIIGE